MNKNTVTNFSSEELEDKGLGGAIKNKKVRRSTLIPLILSLIAALALWIFVVAENNTCSDLTVQVRGNEQLLYSGYSVSSVKPALIDCVLRGKSDAVSQALSDRSLVKASVNIFSSGEEGERPESYVFKSQEDVKPGKYLVEVQMKMPDGVTSSVKTVEVTVSETESRDFLKSQGQIKINKSNYSLANGLHLRSEELSSNTVTVKGDEETVGRISYIGLNIDWLKEIQNDVKATLTPVAYDQYGAEVDGKFLSFEPKQLVVTLKVEKIKTVGLALHVDPEDNTKYILSRGTIRLKGPVDSIDALGDIYYLNEKEFTSGVKEIADSYTVSFRNTDISIIGNETDRFQVKVTKVGATEKKLSYNLSTASIIVNAPDKMDYSFGSLWIPLTVYYTESEGKVFTSENIVATVDLKNLPAGSHVVPVKISFTDTNGISHIRADAVTVRVDIYPISD